MFIRKSLILILVLVSALFFTQNATAITCKLLFAEPMTEPPLPTFNLNFSGMMQLPPTRDLGFVSVRGSRAWGQVITFDRYNNEISVHKINDGMALHEFTVNAEEFLKQKQSFVSVVLGKDKKSTGYQVVDVQYSGEKNLRLILQKGNSFLSTDYNSTSQSWSELKFVRFTKDDKNIVLNSHEHKIIGYADQNNVVTVFDNHSGKEVTANDSLFKLKPSYRGIKLIYNPTRITGIDMQKQRIVFFEDVNP